MMFYFSFIWIFIWIFISCVIQFVVLCPQVRPLFEEHGDVLEVALIKDRKTGEQQGALTLFFLILSQREYLFCFQVSERLKEQQGCIFSQLDLVVVDFHFLRFHSVRLLWIQ